MGHQSAELSLEDLQRLYLGEGQYPQLAEQDHLPYSTSSHSTQPAYFVPTANSLDQNQSQAYGFSFPHQSITPSSTSEPIDFVSAPTSSSGFLDFDAYLDDDYQGGGGAYTPSYGSYSSQNSSFGSATGPSGSPFSTASSYNDRSSFGFPASSQPFAAASNSLNPFADYRDMGLDPLEGGYAFAGEGAGAVAPVRSLSEAYGGAGAAGEGMELDLELSELLSGGGMEGGLSRDERAQSAGEQGRDDTLSFGAGSYGHDGEGDSSRRSSVFPGTLTDSPPTSTVDLPSVVARASPAPLAPLAIPTTLSPSLHLTQPTPHTARPREKGAGTLELEQLLGDLVNEEERAKQTFNYPIPTRRSPEPTTAFAPPLSTLSKEGSTYSFPSTDPSLSFHLFQPSTTAFLPTHRRLPNRQRSRSESDMHEAPTYNFNTHSLQLNQPPTSFDYSTGPLPPIQDLNAYWMPTPDGSGVYQGYAPAAYGGGVEQHELGSRARSAHAMRRDVGPGYASGLTPPMDPGSPGQGVRRARSHGHGHARNSRSEDFSHPYGAFNGVVTSQDGHLAPPGARPPQQQPPSHPPPPAHGFAPPPPTSSFPPSHLQPGTEYYDSQGAPTLAPPRTPFVYHSPIGTPSPPGDRSATPSGSEDGREQAVTVESKTTPATIEAAMRRRKAGTEAKFKCDLCGETFTRRYNLRGHQRAHRNEKPFACSYEGCEKAFARAHDCKRHELLHLGVRRYHCDPCQRDFVRLDALQRHHRSEVGQACVNQLRAAGFHIAYDTTVQGESNVLL